MARIQLFDTPHKALRLAFSDLLTLAGTTDFSHLKEVAALKEKMAAVFSLVYSHSHHEDDICFTELDQMAPNATRHDRQEHIRLHERLDTLLLVVSNLLDAIKSGKNAAEAGRDLYTELCTLHAEMLVHMMEEERDTQPIFWAHMTDEQIAGFEPRILGSMTPEMSALWMRYIIPSQPHAMRVDMFKGMQAHAPAFVFEANMRLAEEVLPTTEFENLESAFQPAMA